MQLTDLPKIERDAIDMLLEGAEHKVLRKQLNAIAQVTRIAAGSGLHVVFELATHVERLDDMANLDIDGVFATSAKCEEIGFILFVKEGLINYLEGYVFGGDIYPSYEGCDYVLSRQSVNLF